MNSLPTRQETIWRIRTALKRRSGKPWSVRGGRGTSWGWITITSPPKRQNEYGYLTDEDRKELARLLGLEKVHNQGVLIDTESKTRQEYAIRAETGSAPE